MKIKVLILFFSLNSLMAFCQDSLPESHINFGIGIGQSYGGFGVKSIIGKRNSGLLIGLGYCAPDITGYKIGVQISSKRFYIEAGYGVVGAYQINDGPWYPIEHFSVLIGGMVSLDKKRRLFIDMGVGFSFRPPKLSVVFPEKYDHILCYNIGVGYRFGDKIKLK